MQFDSHIYVKIYKIDRVKKIYLLFFGYLIKILKV